MSLRIARGYTLLKTNMKKLHYLLIASFLIIYNSFSQKVYNKVFVLGNSLTQGFGTHGMASTDTNTDYYYWVQQAIFQKNESLLMKRFSGGSWESNITSKNRFAFLNNSVINQIDGKEDLIIIQLGDNVNSEDKRKTLLKDVKTLIEWFKEKCPNAEILWVYGWYGVNINMPIIKQAIETVKGCKLVDISKFTKDKFRNEIGNTYKDKNGNISTINSKGVASHPGDLGMKMIANEILSMLGLEGSNSKLTKKNTISIKISDINGKTLDIINSNNEIRFETNQLSDENLIITIYNNKKREVIFERKINIADK